MLGNLKNPPEPFGDIIRTHFKLKANEIKKQLDEWLKEDDSRPIVSDGVAGPIKAFKALGGLSSGSQSAFKKDVDELKSMLMRLELDESAGASSSRT